MQKLKKYSGDIHRLEELGVGTFKHWAAIGCIGLPYAIASWFNEEIFCLSSVSVAARWHHGIDNIYIISVAAHVDNPEDWIKYKDSNKNIFYLYVGSIELVYILIKILTKSLQVMVILK